MKKLLALPRKHVVFVNLFFITLSAITMLGTMPSSALLPAVYNHELHQFFIHEIKVMYGAEKAIIKVMPDIMEKATNRDLVAALSAHKDETQKQLARLEEIFVYMKETPKAEKCEGIDGILKEYKSNSGKIPLGMVRDQAILLTAEKLERYETVSYQNMADMARILGESKVASLLEKTLAEEKAGAERLTKVTMTFTNQETSRGLHTSTF